MITKKDEEIIEIIVNNQRLNMLAAAYTIYTEMTPKNKKPISQREFHQAFLDNWKVFDILETD